MTNLTITLNRLSNKLADIVENREIQTSIQRCLDLILDTGIRASILVFICSVFLTLGPAIESKFFGVFNRIDAYDYKQLPNGDWIFHVNAKSPWYRLNCTLDKNQIIEATALKLEANKLPEPIAKGIIIAKDSGNPSNSEYDSVWEFKSNKHVPEGSVISGTMHHQCHILWTTTTVFGPFIIKLQ